MINLLFLFCIVSIKVKNKAPAPVQITAEQLLREAKERQLELVPPVSKLCYSQTRSSVPPQEYINESITVFIRLTALGAY